tara:strand:- start:1280 stop:2035 length:756 start_codon:yes stop_codon:yes gene_type:complete
LKKKITIITPTFNSAKTILANLASVKNQKYKNLEHIIIDNNSDDETLDLIKKNNNKRIKVISENDNGIYDAINKGIKLAKGEIISILHSDDKYYNNQTLLNVIKAFEDRNIDVIYGDLLYVGKNNFNKIIRYWKSNDFYKGMFLKGWSPPHPSFFTKKKIHDRFGVYSTKIGNPADIELMYRFLELKKVNSKYINKILIKMRYGGQSNKNLFDIFKQNMQILNFLNLKNPLKIIKFVYFKFLNRTLQFINR